MTDKEEPGDELDVDSLRFLAMLTVARERVLRDRQSAIRELKRLRSIAEKYNADPELVIGCERSLLEADTLSMPAHVRLERMQELDRRARAELPEENRERRSVANFLASALRRVDREAGIAAYRDELALRERVYGPDHRSIRYSRLNLCVALRSYGAPIADLVEAHEILTDEWRSRREAFGEDNPFTWMAAHAYVHNALRAHQLGHPLETPPALVEKASAVVDARQRVLGTAHRRTLFARITLAEARGRAGQTEQAVWGLVALRSEVDAIGLDEPERIPLLLMEFLAGAADPADRRAAADYGREARVHLVQIYGPAHPQVVDVESAVGRITASLEV